MVLLTTYEKFKYVVEWCKFYYNAINKYFEVTKEDSCYVFLENGDNKKITSLKDFYNFLKSDEKEYFFIIHEDRMLYSNDKNSMDDFFSDTYTSINSNICFMVELKSEKIIDLTQQLNHFYIENVNSIGNLIDICRLYSEELREIDNADIKRIYIMDHECNEKILI